MPQPSTTTQRDEDPFVDENSIFEPLTSIPTDPFCVVYNARCTTPPPPPQVSHSDTPLPLPAPATPTRPSRTTASTAKFPPPQHTLLCQVLALTNLPVPRSHRHLVLLVLPPPTISKGISRSGSSRFGTFSQMFNTPIQPLWRGTASTANSSASSTPTVSAQSTITTALGATANATVNAPATDADTAIDLAESGSLPSDKEQGSSRFWNRSRSASTTSNNSTSTATLAGTTTILSNNDLPFVPLDVSIPCESLLDDAFMNTVSFSNRGSIMLGAQDAAAIDGAIKQHTMSIDSSSSTSTSTNADTDESNDMNNSVKGAGDGSPQGLMSTPDIRVLAADVEKESQKVRSLYTVGDGSHGEPGKRHSYCERLEPTPEVPSEENELDPVPNHLSPAWQMPASGSSSSLRSRGGGLEDWDDLEGAHVDRYGFITLPPPPGSRMGTPTETRSASGSPRKRSLLQKRDPYSLTSTLSGSGRRTPTRKVSARSLNTQTSELSVSTSLRSSRSVIRQASNLLPHNRDRRWMDEAGDMLNAAPSLQDIVDEIQAEKLTEVMKRKEWERSEKWRKMAKVVRRGGEGEGMEFEFDMRNPKLIERTWKGIPDRWRGAAWWSFMATSAREHEGSPSEERIVAEFHRLQRRSSPDDVQIDLDVPRTISRHIMFRRRYRGGQRLLFRVLHAISIYYPETGYVQGMASLAATLLCYFDEEKCFVMLVRMWHLRGLARLYRPGFEELMAAMGDFSKHWLNKEVASKLDELCIDTTAYGTRWYLTLFNLSVPFPAQLRIWDVFLLLGNDQPSMSESRKSESNTPQTGEYDVLHATSAALAQALREVLLDAEFENAMKALTSSIPVKDEDLLMKVVKAEYKQHHGKKKT
ncbi:Rab-GTPase-TBC domain [Fusarium oxysporum f. sp. vasinfectum]|nr:Rab-GTPase-TBC domain [Fusarium oxysporum f. sp. vasinfectum]